MLTKYLPAKLLTKANVLMTLGNAIGTVASYLISALFVGFGGESWRIPYYIISAIFFASLIPFVIVLLISKRYVKINTILDNRHLKANANLKVDKEDDNNPLILVQNRKKRIAIYVFGSIALFLVTAVYYCITGHMSAFFVDIYQMPQDVSIYISTITPIAFAIGPIITIRSCDNHKDFIRQATKFLLFISPIPFLLIFIYQLNVVLVAVMYLAFVALVFGVKSILLSVTAFKERKVMNTGAYIAIVNSAATISAGITPTIIGAVVDNHGWKASYFVTLGLTIVLLALLVVIDIYVRKDFRKAHGIKKEEKID
jgi:MFS family permease